MEKVNVKGNKDRDVNRYGEGGTKKDIETVNGKRRKISEIETVNGKRRNE